MSLTLISVDSVIVRRVLPPEKVPSIDRSKSCPPSPPVIVTVLDESTETSEYFSVVIVST